MKKAADHTAAIFRKGERKRKIYEIFFGSFAEKREIGCLPLLNQIPAGQLA